MKARDPEVMAPAVRHTRRVSDGDRYGRDRGGLIERQVTVPNHDGTTTVHTFWTDSHDAPARVAWPADEDDLGSGGKLISWHHDETR